MELIRLRNPVIGYEPQTGGPFSCEPPGTVPLASTVRHVPSGSPMGADPLQPRGTTRTLSAPTLRPGKMANRLGEGLVRTSLGAKRSWVHSDALEADFTIESGKAIQRRTRARSNFPICAAPD